MTSSGQHLQGCLLAFAKGCSSNLIYLAHSSSDNLCRWVTFTGLSANQRLSTWPTPLSRRVAVLLRTCTPMAFLLEQRLQQ